MDWVKWVIPLIALAVWILSNLAKNQQPERRLPRVPAPDRDDTPRRRTAEELDRIISEARKRREAPAPVLPPPVLEETVEASVAPPPRAMPDDADKIPTPRKESRKTTRKEESPRRRRRLPNPETVVANEEIIVARVVKPVQDTSALTPTRSEAAVVTRSAASVASANTLLQVRDMLRSPQSLGVAFLLREILEPPLCLRQKR